MQIELESRSKGFQWFFSFYLVFLAESDAGHRDAILLLDEPGLHLHPTAQQDLIAFFEKLAENNQLLYTTHSPFLIDSDHLDRVRPVTEDETGHSQVSVGSWPSDRDTIFPLQAAVGYATIKELFRHMKNVLLVEGWTDYRYLRALRQHCHATGRQSLPDDIYIVPCDGTKYVKQLAALFLANEVRPVVLLDSDKAGRERQNTLMQKFYTGHRQAVLILSDVLGQEECEIEDLVGEKTILQCLKDLLIGQELLLNESDYSKGSLVDRIKSAAKRQNISLPDEWKSEIAHRIVDRWSTIKPNDMPPEILDKAEALFKELRKRFDKTAR